jgi:hypothetical protein
MKIKPMLGEFALDDIEYIESSESRALVEHRVPGLAGNYFQDMGAAPNTIVVAGTKSGDEARDNFLTGIREIFNKGEQTTFVADINTATDITDVVIEDLEVAEAGGRADSFRYLIKLRKYTKPPEPPQTSLLDAGILDDALNAVDALNALDALSSISNLGDPTGPVRGALDGVKAATGGLDQSVNDLRNLFGAEAPESAAPAPEAAMASGSAPAPSGSSIGNGASAGAAAPSPTPSPPAAPVGTGGPSGVVAPSPAPSPSAPPIGTNGSAGGAAPGPTAPMSAAPVGTGGSAGGGAPSGVTVPPAETGSAAPGASAGAVAPSAWAVAPAETPSVGAAAPNLGETAGPAPQPLPDTAETSPAAKGLVGGVQDGTVAPAAPAEEVPGGDVVELVDEPLEPVKDVIKEAPQCKTALDVGFVHFNNDRHVLMPEGPTPDPGEGPPGAGIDGLQVLAMALAHAQQHPEREMLVTGHSDTKGAIQHNLQLSARRADSAFFVLQGQVFKDEWVKSALLDGGKADDWRRILRWVSKQYGFGAEASDPARPDFAKDQPAIKKFQQDYNNEVDRLSQSGKNPFSPGFKEKIPPSQMGFVGISTWRAFFDFYQRELMRLMNLQTYDELRKIQESVKLARAAPSQAPTLGCGEFHSRDVAERQSRRERGYREKADPPQPKDRRVEILFFDPGELPAFDCHPTTDVLRCDPAQCLLYKDQDFALRRLPLIGEKPATKIALVGVDVKRRGGADFTEGRNFSPLLKETARFRIRLDDLATPFEGTLRVVVSRPTDDGFGQVVTLEQQVCSLTEKQIEVAVEWDGKAGLDVPRHLSVRTTPDLNNNGKPMRIPLREMSKGDNARHGVYVVERIELAEKDGVVIASDKPQDPGLVVPVVLTVFFRMSDFVPSLGDFGIGDGTKFNAPYIDAIKEAIVNVIAGYYKGVGARVATTTKAASSIGIEIEIGRIMGQFGVFPGGTGIEETGSGFVIKSNIFAWREESFGVLLAPGAHFRAAVGPSSILFRNQDQNSDDSKVLSEIFGPLGVARDSGINPPNPPKATKPRTVTAGRVEGQVTDLDSANTTVSVSAAGVIKVGATDPKVVPPKRASDIERALNAFTNSVGIIAAHELGHCLGLVAKADPKKTKIDIPGKGAVVSPLAGDDENHDRPPLAGNFMDPGETIQLRTIFTPGKRLAMRDSNRKYLLDCFPVSP